MNERILMKLAEAEKKKRGVKQTIKDNAWSIALAPGSLGFAIDQQRRNVKKERATGEKPKTLYERRPGVVAGAVTGGLTSALRLAGSKAPISAYPLAAAGGALGGAVAGALISDPLARWGTKRYYRKKDEKALRNQQRNEFLAKRLAENEILRQAQVRQAEKYLQENPLQKTAAYGDTIKNLASRVEGAAQNKYLNAFRKHHNTPGVNKPLFNEANKRIIQQRNLARSASQFVQRNAKALTTGAIGLGAAGAVAGGIAAARAIKNKRQGQEKTASYYAVRELLGLQKEANLTLAGPQNVKETPAKDQILKMIRDLA